MNLHANSSTSYGREQSENSRGKKTQTGVIYTPVAVFKLIISIEICSNNILTKLK